LKQNLGLLLSSADIRGARGQRWEQLSALLPHVTASPYVADSQINLAELGLTSFGGLQIPVSIGPFSYLDARVSLTQTPALATNPRSGRTAPASSRSSCVPTGA